MTVARAEGGSMDWRAAGERIDALLAASASGGRVAGERAEELVRLVTDLYGAGLERMLEIVHDRGGLTDDVLKALAADDLVASVLLVHGLHPYSVSARVQQALDSVRPYLGSHGGDVELLEITDAGTVRLRLLGSCDGCPSSSVTLKLAVEGAIEAAAPETSAIEVEMPTGSRTAGVIPATSLFSRVNAHVEERDDGGASWASVPDLVDLPSNAVAHVRVGDVPIVAGRVGTDLFAFRDQCGRCDAAMAGAVLTRRLGGGAGNAVLRCPTCHAHYDVRQAGACLDDDQIHLYPLPLLADPAGVSIAVPAPVAT